MFFSFSDDEIIPIENNNYGIRYTIPVIFRGKKILGVWIKGGYIEDLYTYSAINLAHLKKSIIIGDFNSNVMWNKKHGERNHTKFDLMMRGINLHSAYHHQYKENLGEETKGTFYMYRKKDKKYYIDYAYIPTESEFDFSISDKEVLEYSDHMIITLNINI